MAEKVHVWKKKYYKPFSTAGFLLVGIGLFWLLRDLGIIPQEIPLWPIILISAGLVMILNRACIKCE
jgi:uncharacterized membrane protein